MHPVLKVLFGLLAVALTTATSLAADDRPAKTVLVAVDLSSSTVDHRSDYIKYFRMILDTIGEGDTLAVLRIASRPGAGASIEIGPVTIKPIGLTDNARRVKADNLKATLDAIRSFESLVATGTDTKANEGETPVIAVTQSSVRLFDIYRNERKVLVYLSDMLESASDTAKFESSRPPFNQKIAESAFKKIQQDQRIAGLKGVTVYVAGARDLKSDAKNSAIAGARTAATRWFWSNYFSAAGADLKSSAYGPDLLGFSAEECNTRQGCERGFFVSGRDKLITK